LNQAKICQRIFLTCSQETEPQLKGNNKHEK